MSNKRSRSYVKVYKTPQAVNDFIAQFRKDALHSLRNTWHSSTPQVSAKPALEANVERLKAFLLAQCDTIPPPPPPPASEPSALDEVEDLSEEVEEEEE